MATAVHGSSAFFSLDNAGGTPVDLSAHVKELDVTIDNAMHDTTGLGSTSRIKTTGLKDGKFSVTFFNNTTIMTQLNALMNAQSPGGTSTWSFVIGLRGSTSGYEKISGEALVPGLPYKASVDDIETVTVPFEVTGAATLGTF